jgi:phosphate transport system substrate-binding protein
MLERSEGKESNQEIQMMQFKTAMLMTLLAGVMMMTIGANAQAADRLKGRVAIDGSSTVYPITEAVAEEFGKVHRRVRVTVGISGTGGGFKRFVKGETHISDASRPIKKKELDAARKAGIKMIEIPVAYDGLSIVVNRENTWAFNLSINELKKIFLDGSKVKTWRDVRPEWPDVPIKLFIPGTDSGTFDYFKETVAGKKGNIRADVTPSEDDNVLVRGIAGTRGGLGFFGCAYYFENKDKLRAVAIEGVLPMPQTIESGIYAPFSRPLFIYVNAKSADRPEIDAFVKFYLTQGPSLAEEVGYVKLPQIITERALVNYEKRRDGSQFLTAKGEKIRGTLMSTYK